MTTQAAHLKLEADIADAVSRHPGISQGELCDLLEDAGGYKASRVQTTLYSMNKKHKIVRTRRERGGKGSGLYHLWLTVPVGKKAEDFKPIMHKRMNNNGNGHTEHGFTAAAVRSQPAVTGWTLDGMELRPVDGGRADLIVKLAGPGAPRSYQVQFIMNESSMGVVHGFAELVRLMVADSIEQ